MPSKKRAPTATVAKKAEGTGAYQKLATRVGPLRKEDVTCAICWSIFIEPVSLPCDHVLCSSCFKTHLNKTSLQCPHCRKRFGTWSRTALKKNNYVDTALWERIQREFPELVETRLLGGDSQTLDSQEFVSVLERQENTKEPTRKRKRDAAMTDENDERAVYVNRLESDSDVEEEQQQQQQDPEEDREMPQLTLQVGIPILIQERENDETPDSIDLEVNRHFRPICPQPKTPPKKRPDGSFMPEPIIVFATPVKGLALPVPPLPVPCEDNNRAEVLESDLDLSERTEQPNEDNHCQENVLSEDHEEEPPFRFVPLRALQHSHSHTEIDDEDPSSMQLDAEEPPNNEDVDEEDTEFSLFEESPSKRQREEPINPGGSQSLIDEQHSQNILEEEPPPPLQLLCNESIPVSQQSADIDLVFVAEQEKQWTVIKQKCIQEWEDRRLAAKLQKDLNKSEVESRGAGAKDPYSLRNWLIKKEATANNESTPSRASRSSTSSTVTSGSSNQPRRSKRKAKPEK